MRKLKELKRRIEKCEIEERDGEICQSCIKEEGKVSALEDVLDLINKLKDPYPLDVFRGLESEDIVKMYDLIKKETNISPDRLSAHLMRIARENVKEELKKEIIGD